jgi:hypothetical protein
MLAVVKAGKAARLAKPEASLLVFSQPVWSKDFDINSFLYFSWLIG